MCDNMDFVGYVGAEHLGESGRNVMSVAKFVKEDKKVYYLFTITDIKTNGIIAQGRLNTEHLKLFKKLVNDANLEGLKI